MYRRFIIFLTLILSTVSGLSQRWEIKEVVGKRGVNELSPAFFEDGIVYMSNERARYLSGYSDESDQRLYDLYYLDTSQGSDPISFERVVNTFNHEGPATFGRNDSLMIYTRNRILTRKMDKKDKEKNNLALFSVTRGAEGWSEPKMLDLGMEGNNVMHPALSPDGNVLLFASDASNGQGGFDLYLTTWKDGKWVTPVNLGPFLNSENDETFPSFLNKETIVFASNRPGGKGGLDLYMAYWISDSIFVEHFTEPINSEYDDFSLIADPGINEGYFASNRSKHSDDIYHFEYSYPEFGECGKNHKPKFCYNLRDAEDIGSDSIPVRHKWHFGDGKTAWGRKVHHCYGDTGHYDIRLSLVDTTTDLTYMNVANYSLTIERFQRPYIQGPDSVDAGQRVRFGVKTNELPEGKTVGTFWRFEGEHFRRNDMPFFAFSDDGYYDVDVSVLRKEGEDTMVYCAYKTIVVGGVSDRDLSTPEMDTLESVVDKAKPWILTVQITKSEDRMDTSDMYFAKVNYDIREVYNEEDGTYSYEVDASREMGEVYDTYKELVDSGYNEAKIVAYDKEYLREFLDSSKDLSNLDLDLLREENLNEGVSVYFAFDRFVLHDSSIVKIKRYIESFEGKKVLGFIVEGFTDPRGNAGYNLKLSRRRAQKVASYLMQLGIPDDRIRVVDNSEHFDPSTLKVNEEWKSRRVRIIELKVE